MLDAVEITSADILTADDAALHELLISAAYEADKDMASDFTSLPVATALKFLGDHARRDALKVSMRRLMSTTVSYGTKKTRRFENVPLLFSWLESTEKEDIIRYSLPEPIRILMREMPAYAYLELAPISQMKSKYSVRLYRVLAAAAAREKWTPHGQNKVIVSASLEDLFQWTGFPADKDGSMSFGKFRQRVLSDLDKELATVRRFGLRVEEIRREGRGRPLERVDFHLNLRAPSHHMTRATFEPGEHKQRHIGGVDASDYRVNSNIWIKAQNEFWRIQKRPHDVYFSAWQVALQEALDKAPVSPCYTTREYRGQRLLNAIATLGADEAAFKFCAEEVANPDIIEHNSPSLTVDHEDAESARKARIEASKNVQTKKPASNSERNDQLRAVPFTKPAFNNIQPASAEVSYIEEEALDIDISDIDVEMLNDLISSDEPQVFKKSVIETKVDEPVEFEPAEIEDDFGVDDIASAFLAEIIADDEEAPVSKLDGVKEIIWSADDELDEEEIKDQVFPILQNYYFDEHDHTHRIKLTIRWWNWGAVVESTFGVLPVSQRDIDEISRRLDNERVLHETLNLEEYIR
ncbi:RepB family plasmid replication initiator protein [Ochrobactrum chromiisoli]|uniref:RepB family plasmid replication initiator protein n=1 Tax=Ochrobactrum chromiisoli TaxID=2993941 RepID=A0ABT3QKU2_9HYPH|nr:RepB family plasmid replication initiator protein [Ochrobactrum chromiisoli]MCX2696226.1 RepB family plasmid replication initiator protein [Ochrobactrum chromiisoli]